MSNSGAGLGARAAAAVAGMQGGPVNQTPKNIPTSPAPPINRAMEDKAASSFGRVEGMTRLEQLYYMRHEAVERLNDIESAIQGMEAEGMNVEIVLATIERLSRLGLK